MKKQILLIILVLSTYVLTAQWVQQNSGTNTDLNSICFIDNDNGWAVGDSGVILHTSDGGETWIQQDGGTDLDLKSVWFADQDRGWIAGGSSYRYSIILRTLNGGNNWDIVFIDIGSGLDAVCFSDSLTGWAVGHPVVVSSGLKSSDGGQTWSYEPGVGGYDIYFVDSLYGWYITGYKNGSTGITTYFINNSNDGGNSWETQLIVNPHSHDNPPTLNRIHFSDPYHGWVVGSNCVLHTVDAGNNWEWQNCPAHLNLTGVCSTDSLNGWAVGGRGMSGQTLYGVILKTTNGGDEWLQQACDSTNNYFTCVCFTDSQHGWITGVNGTILHTDNGGQTNVEKHQNHTHDLQLRCCPNPFSDVLTITYYLPKPAYTGIEIYNSTGKKIIKLPTQFQPEGKQDCHLKTDDLPAGIYFIHMQTNNQIETQKIIKL